MKLELDYLKNVTGTKYLQVKRQNLCLLNYLHKMTSRWIREVINKTKICAIVGFSDNTQLFNDLRWKMLPTRNKTKTSEDTRLLSCIHFLIF